MIEAAMIEAVMIEAAMIEAAITDTLPAFVSNLGWALVHFLWQGLLVGILAASLLALLRHARPQARYAVACLALVVCLALPLIGLWRGMQSEAIDTDATVAATIAPSTIPTVANTGIAMVSWQPQLQSRIPLLVALWSFGAALLSLRMLLGLDWVGRIRRTATTAIDHAWQARMDRLAHRFGLHRNVGLRIVDDLDSPIATGWWRPIVIVPAALVAHMPADLLEALIAHELAHVKRHDYLVNLLQAAIEALLFYHPVVWWLSRRVRIEREQIADDLAANVLGEPRRLALALQELDRFQFSTSHFAPAAHGGKLMSRIQRLVHPKVPAIGWKMVLPILGLMAICFVSYARSTPVLAAAPAATETNTVSAVTAVAPVIAAEAVAAVDPAAAIEPVPAVTRSHDYTYTDDEARESFALVRADHEHTMFSGNTEDLDDLERAKHNTAGDFVWFRRNGKAYLIQDQALVAKATQAWQPTEALSEQMDALSRQMEPHSQKMDALGKQMEGLSAGHEPVSEAMQALSGEMETLAEQQATISGQMQPIARKLLRADSDAEREALDRQMQALHQQNESLSQQMEKLSEKMQDQSQRMQDISAPMEQLSEQMQAASEPMHELGRKMDILGRQQEKLSQIAMREVQAVIDQALRNGKALPAATPGLN